MSRSKKSDIRSALTTLGNPSPGSWVIGIEVITRSTEAIKATAARVEGDVAILSTTAGERRIALVEIEDLLIEFCSPGPE